jgi:PAS domain-containing protein
MELPYEATGMRKDGTRIPIEYKAVCSIYQGRKVRASAIRDLSERKQAQAKIYRHSQNLQALFYNTLMQWYVRPQEESSV